MRVVSVTPHANATVYDLTVDGHEFVAEGIVVHNCDEPGTWRRGEETRSNLVLGLRVGEDPRSVWTTTPRTVPVIKELVSDAKNKRHGVVMTRGSTMENRVNLAEPFMEEVQRRYGGTRLGRQELLGELLDDLGTMFARSWFADRLVPEANGIATRIVRYWDLAATPPSASNEDPDYAVGCRVSYDRRKKWYRIEDIVRLRDTPAQVENAVVSAAIEDGPKTTVVIEQEPGSAGKAMVAHYKQVLAQHNIACLGVRPTGSKETRAQIAAGLAEQGRIEMVDADWNLTFLDELEEFPEGKHDDQVDALSGAIGVLHKRLDAAIVAPAGVSKFDSVYETMR